MGASSPSWWRRVKNGLTAARISPAIQTIIVVFNFKLVFLTPHVAFFLIQYSVLFVEDRGGVEDTTFEAKANDTKKFETKTKDWLLEA